MHELSIAVSIIESVEENLPEPTVKVTKIFLKIGKMAGVVKEALEFSFEIAAQGSRLENARLEIEELPVLVECENCDRTIELENPPIFRCPDCRQPTPNLIQGKELQIVSVEIED